MTATYQEFIATKAKHGTGSGFEPTWIPELAMDFQRYLIEWMVRIGRGATFAECGLGKTLMQLAWRKMSCGIRTALSCSPRH